MKTLKAFWNDDCGAIISTELVLVITILGIGMIVGLKSVRDTVVTELADIAQAIAQVDQSYSYSGVSGHGAYTRGSLFQDAADFCEGGANPQPSKCVNVNDFVIAGNE